MDYKAVYEWCHRNIEHYGRTGHGGGAHDLAEGCSSILDVGGGFTPFADDVRALHGMNRAAVVDLSAVPALEQIERGVEFMCADVCSLPYANGEFELVTAFDVLEHVPAGELEQAESELFRVASRRVIVSVGVNSSRKLVNGQSIELHETIQPLTWWQGRLQRYGRLTVHKRQYIPHGHTEAGNIYYLVIDKD